MAVDISQYVANFGQRGTGNPGGGIGYGLQAQGMRNRNRMAEQNRQDVMQERNRLARADDRERQEAFMTDLTQTLQSVDDTQRPQVWAGGMQRAAAEGWDISGDEEWNENMLPQLQGRFGVAAPEDKSSIKPVSMQDREALFGIIESPDSPEWQVNAARIELGLDPRATGSASQTIADRGTADTIAGSEATIAGAKAGASEEAKLQQRAKYEPAIRSAIKTAEDEAKSRGETLTDLNRSKAALPGLLDMSEELKELAPIATYTLAGKFWDQAVKQTGFGSTEGATARAKYNAVIDNQVLPLLKQTFGAAMTEREGERLTATLGDPDASPEEKAAQLDAFIAQKMRDIEAGERELSGGESARLPARNAQGWQLMTDAQGNRAYVGPNGEVEEI